MEKSEKPEMSGKSQGILSNQSLPNFHSDEISSTSKIFVYMMYYVFAALIGLEM